MSQLNEIYRQQYEESLLKPVRDKKKHAFKLLDKWVNKAITDVVQRHIKRKKKAWNGGEGVCFVCVRPTNPHECPCGWTREEIEHDKYDGEILMGGDILVPLGIVMAIRDLFK